MARELCIFELSSFHISNNKNKIGIEPDPIPIGSIFEMTLLPSVGRIHSRFYVMQVPLCGPFTIGGQSVPQSFTQYGVSGFVQQWYP